MVRGQVVKTLLFSFQQNSKFFRKVNFSPYVNCSIRLLLQKLSSDIRHFFSPRAPLPPLRPPFLRIIVRMLQRQPIGTQKQSVATKVHRRLAPPIVDDVADHGAAHLLRHVPPQLMIPPRPGLHLHQREISFRGLERPGVLQDPPQGRRGLFVQGPVDELPPSLALDVGPRRPGLLRREAGVVRLERESVQDRRVGLAHPASHELLRQRRHRGSGLGGDQEAGGGTVEAVDGLGAAEDGAGAGGGGAEEVG
mmetsp:Transcript_23023/g.52715  ORF Transcript_23023/g.52715 Transcript_23023/m.52715 type:complete len:251 (-) Transcript_23023:253-1005(-)